MSNPNVIVTHVNDEVDTKAEAILQDGVCFYWLYIHNTSANTLYISFDGGTTWKKIATDKTLEVKAPEGKQIILTEPLKGKGSAISTQFEILMIVDKP